MAKTKVGLIGLGQMGGPIAGHILKAKHALTVYDLDKVCCKKAAKLGAIVAPDIAVLGKQSDLALVMVGYDNEVWEVCCGKGGLVGSMKRGSTIAILSTITVATMKRIVAAAKRKEVAVIDAPVTRAEEGAIAGNLLLLGSGDEAAFARARPVFEAFCADIFHLGPAGCGQVAKICNNLLLWISVVANYETMNMADKYGLKKSQLVSALMISTGTNGTLHRWEKMTMPWVHKDLAIALEFAEALNVGLPMAGLTKQLFKTFKLPKAR